MIELAIVIATAIAAAIPIAASESDIWMLASMTAGETGLLFGESGDAERWVMWTCRNRVASKDFPNDYWTVIEQGFYGHRRELEPTAEMLVLAREVLGASVETDPTDGCMFVMSGDDVAARGWGVSGAVRIMEEGRWSLYFFREMPE